jgi:hypothetical protein
LFVKELPQIVLSLERFRMLGVIPKLIYLIFNTVVIHVPDFKIQEA